MPLPLMFWAAPPIKSLSAHMGTWGREDEAPRCPCTAPHDFKHSLPLRA